LGPNGAPFLAQVVGRQAKPWVIVGIAASPIRGVLALSTMRLRPSLRPSHPSHQRDRAPQGAPLGLSHWPVHSPGLAFSFALG